MQIIGLVLYTLAILGVGTLFGVCLEITLEQIRNNKK